jgi:hypothetical protein
MRIPIANECPQVLTCVAVKLRESHWAFPSTRLGPLKAEDWAEELRGILRYPSLHGMHCNSLYAALQRAECRKQV